MTIDEATTYVTTAITQALASPRERWCFGITGGDDLIGLIKFRDRGAGPATLSYILREDSWGRGYGTAAVRQVIVYAFTAVFQGRVDGVPVAYLVYEIRRTCVGRACRPISQ